MKIITNLKLLNRQFKKPVIGIGIFDGVHLGHKKILKRVVAEARRIGGTSIVITFNPHPARILDMIGAPPLLVSLKHRLNLIDKEGIDVACVLNFDQTFARYDAALFVKKILIKKLGVYSAVVGSNFKFGRDKKGDINLLRSIGKKAIFSVKAIPLFKIDSNPISSTRIRRLIISGRIRKAQRLLGRPVSILGTVVKGSRRGRLLGYPTANINPHHEAIPPSGVYAVYVIIDSVRYKGILNIGVRPTFNKGRESRVKGPASAEASAGRQGERTIEVHIFGFNKNIYRKDIEIIFVKKIRNEKRFSGKEGLIKQIRIDECSARMVL